MPEKGHVNEVIVETEKCDNVFDDVEEESHAGEELHADDEGSDNGNISFKISKRIW